MASDILSTQACFMNFWTNKKAVVAGASSGLGFHIAQALSERGVEVVLAARGEEKLAASARQLANKSHHFACDVLKDHDVDRLVHSAVELLGGIDIWVNAAGRSTRGALADTSMDEFRELWELNFLATVRCSQAVLPHLVKSKGHLVNIGSLASKFAPRWLGAYPTSKFPLAAFCQQLRLEQAEHGLHVLLVCPGPLAREDSGDRYNDQAEGLPDAAKRPGGAKIGSLDPRDVSQKVLKACQHRKAELVIPAKARLLAAITQLSASWGDWLLRKKTG